MNLLHLGTHRDELFQAFLVELTSGVSVHWKSRLTAVDTLAELESQIARVPGGIAGIVCTSELFLKKLLYSQPDFIAPNTRKGVTLNDYQGSLLYLPTSKTPVVILNPLENLVTIPWAKHAARRFISKLTKPDSFFKQLPFKWQVAEPDKLPAIFTHWQQTARLIAIDIETAVDDPLRRINCVGYAAWIPSTNSCECIVIPFTDSFNRVWVQRFNELAAPKIFQNGLYDNLYFARWGCPTVNWLHDTQHLFHSMFSEYPKRLDFITAYALREVRYWKDDGKSGDLLDYYRYNARDCWATLNSYLALLEIAEPYALKNYLLEFPLVFPCHHCELEGLKWNSETAKRVSQELVAEVEKEELGFKKAIASPNFNLNSPPQVKQLFKVLGVGHLPSTDAANMLKAQAAHPLNNKVLGTLVKIKKKKKLLSTYFVAEKFWNSRLYYKLNPAGTDTGRLASSESSFWCGLQIQNIPRGDKVKQCIEADDGWVLCEIDKAQSEARCVGYLAGEEKLIELVEGPHDYHSWNAASFFGVPYESIYDESKRKVINVELRDLAKRTNHGANYNMGGVTMLDTMGPERVSRAKIVLKRPAEESLKEVCSYMLGVYNRTYPKIKGLFYDTIIKQISLTGRLVSPLGWTRIFFGKPSRKNKPLLNAAIAHPAQNLSVGIINQEFYNVWRASVYDSYYKEGTLLECKLRRRVRIKAQIHDSILFEHKQEDKEAIELVSKIMTTYVKITGADKNDRVMLIPSEVSASVKRWSDTK